MKLPKLSLEEFLISALYGVVGIFVMMLAPVVSGVLITPPENPTRNYTAPKMGKARVVETNTTEHRTEGQAGFSMTRDTGNSDEGDAENAESDKELNQTTQRGQKDVGKRERLLNLLTRIEALEAKINEKGDTRECPRTEKHS